MPFRLSSLRNSTLYAACCIALSFVSAGQCHAQQPDALDDVIPDPLGTSYTTGAVPLSEGTKRGITEVPRFRAFLPVSVDLSSHFPKPGKQGKLGSCASWAIGYAARSYYSRTVNRLELTSENIVSPSDLYHRARTGSCEDGSSFEENVRILKKGVLSLLEAPYSESCVPQPDMPAPVNRFSIDGMDRVAPEIDDIKGQLAQGHPPVLSFRWSKHWDDHRGSQVLSRDGPDALHKGEPAFHAVVAVGYDDRRQALRMINSWGRGWGDRGYFWLSYDMVRARLEEAVVLKVPSFTPTPVPEPANPDADRLSALLAKLNAGGCASLVVRFRGASRFLSGYVGSEEDLQAVKVAAAASSVSIGDLAVAPWPQCELRQTLAAAIADPDTPRITIPDRAGLKSGQTFTFSVQTPSHFSYVYITYVQADGTVVHLEQPEGIAFNQAQPRSELRFGDGQNGRARFRITPPFGREMVITIASRSPLFERSLPRVQSAREYLSDLRRALIYKPQPDMPDRIIAAEIATFETREN